MKCRLDTLLVAFAAFACLATPSIDVFAQIRAIPGTQPSPSQPGALPKPGLVPPQVGADAAATKRRYLPVESPPNATDQPPLPEPDDPVDLLPTVGSTTPRSCNGEPASGGTRGHDGEIDEQESVIFYPHQVMGSAVDTSTDNWLKSCYNGIEPEEINEELGEIARRIDPTPLPEIPPVPIDKPDFAAIKPPSPNLATTACIPGVSNHCLRACHGPFCGRDIRGVHG